MESGGHLGPVRVAYETWGRLNPDRSNAVLVLHALTGDSHASGRPGPGHLQAGWWDAVVGPGRALGHGYAGSSCAPTSSEGARAPRDPPPTRETAGPTGGRFPLITIRDQVAVEVALADALGVDRWAAAVGGSMGGMRVLEWAVSHPERLGKAVVIAVGASASAEQIALCSVQNEAIRLDPNFRGGDYYDAPVGAGPHAGLGVARRIGHVSYRSEPELQARFGRRSQEDEDPMSGGRFAVESYLDHHAAKLAHRFDANSYIVLSEAMNHHDVGRGRGGERLALSRVTAATTVVSIDSDRLYPPWQQRQLCEMLPGAPQLQVVHSDHGHDGFLVESASIGAAISAALGVRPTTAPHRSDGVHPR